VPDLKRRLPGRGVWVEARRARVDEAVKRKIFARGFKAESGVSPELGAEIDALLERGALDMLSLANKAGRVVTGFGKVETALDRNGVALVLHADDAARDGRRKLAQAARRGTGGGEVKVLGLFSSRQLDLALGRENVVHAALLADPVSDAFIARALSLARYRDAETGQPAETDQE
jgi:ribosomal protein L7Ae-like RNA K-turn-binding protein